MKLVSQFMKMNYEQPFLLQILELKLKLNKHDKNNIIYSIFLIQCTRNYFDRWLFNPFIQQQIWITGVIKTSSQIHFFN